MEPPRSEPPSRPRKLEDSDEEDEEPVKPVVNALANISLRPKSGRSGSWTLNMPTSKIVCNSRWVGMYVRGGAGGQDLPSVEGCF